MGLNKVLLIGNLEKDSELGYTEAGKPVANFRIITRRSMRVNDQTVTEDESFFVVAFGQLAEVTFEFLKKGKSVFVEGRMQTKRWTDCAGAEQHHWRVIAENIRIIGQHDNNEEVNA